MELWIRSQDKTKILKVVAITAKEGFINGFSANNEYYSNIGEYQTKERALEILDEIQDLMRFQKFEQPIGDGWISVENNTVLYMMPKE